MRLKSDLILLVVAAVWGSGFLAQRLAVSQLSTFYFNGGRFLIAAFAMLLLTVIQKPQPQEARLPIRRQHWPWVILAGLLLFAGTGLQQAGLATTSIGNASFITGLYVVLVPLILFVFWRQQIAWFSWMAVGLAASGVALLSLQDQFRLSPGDVLELIGAFMWALHVITVGRLAQQGVDVLWLSVIQFAVSGGISLLVAFELDPRGSAALFPAWPVLLYAALIPTALGFSLQIAGQKHAPSVDAAIILSMEAVFGTLFAYLFMHEILGPRQLAGCALILAAILLSQVRSVDPVTSETAQD